MNTTYFLNQVMGNVFGTKVAPALPKEYYIGLSTSEPSLEGVCTGEPTVNGTGYSRVLLSSLTEPTNGAISNSAAVSFAESITDWGTMLYYVVYDAKIAGNLLFYGALSISRSVEPGTVITVKTGELTITLSNPTV